MGQYDVYHFLKNNNGKWFTSLEISQQIGINRGCVQHSIRMLLKSGEILQKCTQKNRVWYAVRE